MFSRGNIAKIPRGEGSRSSPVHFRPFILGLGPLGGAPGTILELFWVPLGISLGTSGALWELFGDPAMLGSLCWSLGPLGHYLDAPWHLKKATKIIV